MGVPRLPRWGNTLRLATPESYRDFTLILRHDDLSNLVFLDLQYELLILQRSVVRFANWMLDCAQMCGRKYTPHVTLCHAFRDRKLRVLIAGSDIYIATRMKSLVLVSLRIAHFAAWYIRTGQGSVCAEDICRSDPYSKLPMRQSYGACFASASRMAQCA